MIILKGIAISIIVLAVVAAVGYVGIISMGLNR